MLRSQKHDYFIIICFSLSIFFWDLDNIFSNFRFAVLLIPLFYLFFFQKFFLETIKKNLILISTFSILLFSHYFISYYFISFDINYISIVKLIFLIFIIISLILSSNIIEEKFFLFINISIALIFSFILIDIITNIFDKNLLKALSSNRFENCYHGYFTELSFTFKEESHFAMNVAALLLTSIFVHLEYRRIPNIIFSFLIILIILSYVFALSLTFIIGSLFISTLIFFFSKKKKTKIVFSFIFTFYFFSFIAFPLCTNKAINIMANSFGKVEIKFLDKIIIKSENMNQSRMGSKRKIEKKEQIPAGLSTGVYINSINITKKIYEDYIFGVGFDNYIYAFEKYINLTAPSSSGMNDVVKSVEILNKNDGSNNLSKLYVEFGILSLFIYICLVSFIFSKKINSPIKVFVVGCLIIQLFLRGAGYFNGGFFLLIFLSFYLQKKKLNEK